MPVTLDPDAAAVYKAFQDAGRPPYESVSPAEAREFYLQARFASNPEPPELKSIEPLVIPSPAGSIPARIYTPAKLSKANDLAPCLVFFHGGGYCSGSIRSHRRMVSEAGRELHALEHAMADPSRMGEIDELVERFGRAQARFDELGGYALESRARATPLTARAVSPRRAVRERFENSTSRPTMRRTKSEVSTVFTSPRATKRPSRNTVKLSQTICTSSKRCVT